MKVKKAPPTPLAAWGAGLSSFIMLLLGIATAAKEKNEAFPLAAEIAD